MDGGGDNRFAGRINATTINLLLPHPCVVGRAIAAITTFVLRPTPAIIRLPLPPPLAIRFFPMAILLRVSFRRIVPSHPRIDLLYPRWNSGRLHETVRSRD